MTQEHPITPPTELVEQWFNDSPMDRGLTLAAQAARWGADQELEACCEYMLHAPYGMNLNTNSNQLRFARRPQPPSLKEQALEQLRCIQTDLNKFGMGVSTDTIRRALEQL